MKILFIHTAYKESRGGEDTVVEAEIDLLSRKGHDVRLELFDNGEMQEGVFGKIKAGLSSVYNIRSAKRIKDAIKTFRPDVVHLHNFFFTASPSVIIAAARMKVPLVVTIHNFRLICANSLLLRDHHICELCVQHKFPWYGVKYKCYHGSRVQSAMVGTTAAIHKLVDTWNGRIDKILAPANFIRQKLINSSLALKNENIIVKRNFIADPGQTQPHTRKPYYLFVGRLTIEKGVSILLQAWSKLPQFELLIAGSGPEERYLKEQYGNVPNIKFLGLRGREEILKLMAASRALVFPSIWYEGLPVSIVEAFATGTPVIGSRIGAIEEMINDGANGLLFEMGKPQALSKAIMRMEQFIKDGNYILYGGARTAFMENYHEEIAYKEVMSIYQSVIAGKLNDKLS